MEAAISNAKTHELIEEGERGEAGNEQLAMDGGEGVRVDFGDQENSGGDNGGKENEGADHVMQVVREDGFGGEDGGRRDNELEDDRMKGVEEENIGGENDRGMDDEGQMIQDVNKEDNGGEDDEGEGDMEKDDEEEESEDAKGDSIQEEDEEEDVEGIENNPANAKGGSHIGTQIHSTRASVRMKPTTQSFHRRRLNDATKPRRSLAKVKEDKTIYDEVDVNSKSFPVYIDLSGDVSAPFSSCSLCLKQRLQGDFSEQPENLKSAPAVSYGFMSLSTDAYPASASRRER